MQSPKGIYLTRLILISSILLAYSGSVIQAESSDLIKKSNPIERATRPIEKTHYEPSYPKSESFDCCTCKNILKKLCEVDSKIDDLDEDLEDHDKKMCSKIDLLKCEHFQIMVNQCSIFDKICRVDSKVDEIDEKLCTVDSKVDVIDFELGECCTTVNSKLDVIDFELGECCTTVNSKLDVIDFELGECCTTVNSKLDVIDFELGECCTTVNSKLDDLDEDLKDHDISVCSKFDEVFEDFQETWTILDAIQDKVCSIDSKFDELVDCAALSIRQADVPMDGVLILSGDNPNKNYFLAEDLVATISIVTHDICLCLNCHELTGRIVIDAENVKVKNGSVTTPVPENNEEAALAAI